MGFGEAVKSVFGQYARFSGRARRSEFWFFFLFAFLLGTVGRILDSILGTGFIESLLQLAVLVPTFAVGARRLHDTDRTGWWQLLVLIPVLGWIPLVVFWCQDSHGAKAHGPSPKGISALYAPPVGY